MVFCILVETTCPTFSFFVTFCVCCKSAITSLLPASRAHEERTAYGHGRASAHGISSGLPSGPCSSGTGAGTTAPPTRATGSPDLSCRFHGFCRHASLKLRLTSNQARGQRQLRSSQAHCFSRNVQRHAFHLEENLAGTDHTNPFFRRTLTFTHSGFSRLLGDRLVRKQPDPYLAAAFDVASHRDTGSLNLA